MYEIPAYCLRAYALFFTKHGSREAFRQSELNWIVSQSMRKKIFAILLRAGWLQKHDKEHYVCVHPEKVMRQLVEFKVPTIMNQAEKQYAFTGLSAIEIWSDYSYIQRSIERSPYFIKIFRKDMVYWKHFFSKHEIPYYVNQGTTIGEFVILLPVSKFNAIIKENIAVEPLSVTIKNAKKNTMFKYAYDYMLKKYGNNYGTGST